MPNERAMRYTNADRTALGSAPRYLLFRLRMFASQ
jgi:hypothetical protein